MFLGGGEDEDGVVWWLFEGFEEGVESRLREHVHLVDDIDTILSHLGRNPHLVREVPDVLHRVVGGGIELVNRKTPALVETPARLALAAGIAFGGGIQTVDGLGEDACTGGLTHTPGATEKIGVGQLTTRDGVFESVSNVALSDDRFEGHWAILASRNNKVAIHR